MDKQKFRIEKGYELTAPVVYPDGTVFVIGDLHLNHANIITYCNRPFDEENVEEMNNVLIRNWNFVVKPTDFVFYLGDMTLGNSDKFIEQLNGNIFFIRGNHDITKDPDSIHDELHFSFQGINFRFVHDPNEHEDAFDGWTIHGHHHNNYPDGFPFFNPEECRINVSVEMIRYQPLPIEEILKLINSKHKKIVTLLDKKQLSDIPDNQSPQNVRLKPMKFGSEAIQREKGYLYFVGKDGFLWAAPMKHNTTGKKKRVGHEKIPREAEFRNLMGKDGFVAKAKMKHLNEEKSDENNKE